MMSWPDRATGKSQLLDGEGGGNANRREGVANILANAEVGEGLCSLSGFLRVRFSHWTVSFYPCSGCVSPRIGGAPASAPTVEAVTGGRESRPREILTREILTETPPARMLNAHG